MAKLFDIGHFSACYFAVPFIKAFVFDIDLSGNARFSVG